MENRESRVSTSFEVRAEEDGVTVEGYAAVFNEDTVIGGQWRERKTSKSWRSWLQIRTALEKPRNTNPRNH